MKRYIRASGVGSSSDEISGTIQVKPDVDVNVVVDMIKGFNVVENIDVSDDVITLSGKYDSSNDYWYMKLGDYIVSGEFIVNHISKGYTTTISYCPSTSKYSLSYWSSSDSVGPKYIFRLNDEGSGKYNVMCQAAYRADGTKKWLHNEVDVTFTMKNGKPYILSGYHIGTQDFDFDKGDPWDDYVEYYQPGITEQILERIKNNDFEYH